MFCFYKVRDNVEFTCDFTNLSFTGTFQSADEVIDLYTKYEGKWLKYKTPPMIGATSQADGDSGSVPKPLIAERDKFLRGDGTWAHDELSKLADFEITDLADGDVPKWDETAQKWINGQGGGTGNVADVYENGVSVLDENHIAQVTSYKEITQSEYDALPDSKLTDNIMYAIKDTGIVEGDKFAPIIYSVEEREVGVWTNGKPLYQKTVSFNAVNSSSWTMQAHNISNIDEIIDFEATIESLGAVYEIPQFRGSGAYIVIGTNSTEIFYINTWLDTTDSPVITATLQYTKTTDIAGSGNWGSNGVPAVHYSTNEQVIGTWIDGKPLYQRVYDFGSSVQIATNGTDISSYVDNVATIKYIIDAHVVSEAYIQSMNVLCYKNSNEGKIFAYSFRSDSWDKIIIQYTKTTD